MRFGPDVKSLLRKLILGYSLYFSNGILNSEGRKIFEELARMLIYEHPEYKSVVKKVRNNPTLENVLKIGRIVLGDEADRLLELAIYGPYSYDIGIKL